MLPLAWAFQKESDILQIFNYYLDKLQRTGIINRLRQKFMTNHIEDTDASERHNVIDLGYEDLTLPFLALITGICVALAQLVVETAIICKKKPSDIEKFQNQNESTTSKKAKEIIDDIYDLLLENHDTQESINFLSKVRMMASLPNDHH